MFDLREVSEKPREHFFHSPIDLGAADVDREADLPVANGCVVLKRVLYKIVNLAAPKPGEAAYFVDDDEVEDALRDRLAERVVLFGAVRCRARDDVDVLLGLGVGVLIGDPLAELVELPARVLVRGRDAGVYRDGLRPILSHVLVFASTTYTRGGLRGSVYTTSFSVLFRHYMRVS